MAKLECEVDVDVDAEGTVDMTGRAEEIQHEAIDEPLYYYKGLGA